VGGGWDELNWARTGSVAGLCGGKKGIGGLGVGWDELNWARTGSMAGSCEHRNDNSGSTMGEHQDGLQRTTTILQSIFWRYCLKQMAYFHPLFYSYLSREQQKFIYLDTVLCLPTLSVPPIKSSRMTGLSVNDVLEGMWKTGVAAEFEV